MHPDPYKRYEELSEYMFDLRQPNSRFLSSRPVPLIERNPLLFWKCMAAILAGATLVLLVLLYHAHRAGLG